MEYNIGMAIPKKIHYVWVGDAPIPKKDQQFIKHWKELNPDFEVKRWSEKDIDMEKYPLVKKAIDEKRWALASDIIRMYAMYNEGGFYFDTDVELLKPLAPFLKYDGVASWESRYWFTTSSFAAKKHSPWIGKVLKRYEITRPKKITNDTFMRTVHSPSIYAKDFYDIKCDGKTHEYADGKFITLAPEYFNPKHYMTGKMRQTENTVAIHHYASTWHSKFEKFMADWGVFWVKLMGPTFRICEFCYHKIITIKIRRELK